MAYLRLYDYFPQIQSAQLDQMTGGDASIRVLAEYKAMEEVTSYLSQKYDIANEFTDTLIWSNLIAYKAKQRVYLDATAYSATALYALGALVLQAGNVYKCTTAITVAEAFTIGKWTLIGVQYAMYYVTLPKPEFNYQTVYAVGDQIYWKDKTYTCVIASAVYGHEEAIQYNEYANLPVINVFPDDATNGVKYWGAGVAYALAVGTAPTASGWTAGDNRSQKIVECLVDIIIYKIAPRMAPSNVPNVRQIRNDDAISWLKACAKGTVTSNVSVVQPKQGRRVRWGGNIKNQNSY